MPCAKAVFIKRLSKPSSAPSGKGNRQAGISSIEAKSQGCILAAIKGAMPRAVHALPQHAAGVVQKSFTGRRQPNAPGLAVEQAGAIAALGRAYRADLGRADLQALGAEVWGVSGDDAASHQRFAARRVSTPVSLVDVLPTILELAGGSAADAVAVTGAVAGAVAGAGVGASGGALTRVRIVGVRGRRARPEPVRPQPPPRGRSPRRAPPGRCCRRGPGADRAGPRGWP